MLFVVTLTKSVSLNSVCKSLNGLAHSAKFNFLMSSFEISASATLCICCAIRFFALLFCFHASSAFFISFLWFCALLSVTFCIFVLQILSISSDMYQISGKVNSISNLSRLLIQYCTCLSIQSTIIF
jgi:hypothetical protein